METFFADELLKQGEGCFLQYLPPLLMVAMCALWGITTCEMHIYIYITWSNAQLYEAMHIYIYNIHTWSNAHDDIM